MSVSEALKHHRSSELWSSVWLLNDNRTLNLSCCKLGSTAAYTTLTEVSRSSLGSHTKQRPQKFRIINKSSFSPPLSTWQQDPSVHQKRMVHLPPVLSMGILPEYIFQAPLLLRCCLNHLARNLPPELTPSNSSLMNTHLQLQGLGR